MIVWPHHLKRLVDAFPPGMRATARSTHYALQMRRGSFDHPDPELRLALALLEEGDWVIDVGAHVGHYTIPLARRIGPTGRVIALEPVAEALQLLTANVGAAELDNVTALGLAASSEPRVVRLQVPRDENGLRRLARARVVTQKPPGEERRAMALPLDRVAPTAPVRVIKIDVEGHEAEVLAGAAELLARGRPLLIVEASRPEPLSALVAAGYEPLAFPDSANVVYAAGQDLEPVRSEAAAIAGTDVR